MLPNLAWPIASAMPSVRKGVKVVECILTDIENMLGPTVFILRTCEHLAADCGLDAFNATASPIPQPMTLTATAKVGPLFSSSAQ